MMPPSSIYSSRGHNGAGPCNSFVAPLSGNDPKVCARCRTKHRFDIRAYGFSEVESDFIRAEATRLGWSPDCGWDADMAARQITDNAARTGIDIQYRQHLIEKWLAQE